MKTLLIAIAITMFSYSAAGADKAKVPVCMVQSDEWVDPGVNDSHKDLQKQLAKSKHMELLDECTKTSLIVTVVSRATLTTSDVTIISSPGFATAFQGAKRTVTILVLLPDNTSITMVGVPGMKNSWGGAAGAAKSKLEDFIKDNKVKLLSFGKDKVAL